MKAEKLTHSDRNYAIAIGIGLALFPVHNKWLVDATLVSGQATFFLPIFGVLIWGLATIFYFPRYWQKLEWGDRKIYIPLLVIVGAMGLSGITVETLSGKFAPLCMGALLFSLYLMARKLGKDIFLPLAIGAGVSSVGVIISGLLLPGEKTGGLVFEYNYDIVVGYALLGVALFIKKEQWVLISLALVAIFLSGSPEGVFTLGVMAVVVLLRRDWGKKLVVAIMPVVVVASLWFGLGYGQELYGRTMRIMNFEPVMNTPTPPSEQTLPPPINQPPSPSSDQAPQVAESEGQGKSKMSPIGYRWEVAKNAMTTLKPLGSGYNLTVFNKLIVHNVPLVIVQQLGWAGILAGIAWLWVSAWCLVRTRWKYVWVLVLALSVFDHFIWTQLAPFFWAIVGVSTAPNNINADLIFKGGNPAQTRAEYMARRFNDI